VLKEITDAKHERQLMAVYIDKKGAWSAAASASADVSTARCTCAVAKAAVPVATVEESPKGARRLTEAAASCAKEATGIVFAVYIPHLDELETRYRSCKYALMAAEKRMAAAIIAAERAAKAVKAVEAKAARILQDAATVDSMLVRQQAVAKEYAKDASMKLQRQMRD
jgi:hypothetical protein